VSLGFLSSGYNLSMDVRVRERLIGALVLVAVIVLIVPAILKGREPGPAEPAGQQPTRRVEVPIDDAAAPPEEQVLVPEPVLPDTAPADTQRSPMPPPVQAPPEETKSPPAAEPRRPPPRSAPAKPPPEPAARPATTAPGSAWAVQLGAFSDRSKAEQLVAQLRERRYAAFILEYRASGQVLYRVRVGPEQDRARAQEIAARLAKDGFQTVVARHP
jgi:DedD protein